jgi:hypothetical protein
VDIVDNDQKTGPFILEPAKIGRFFPFGIQPRCGGELASVTIDVNAILRVLWAERLLHELDLKAQLFGHRSNSM